ncbi:MAG: metallophosphoesterase [Promethearchaeati archaeon SRVP18_Atabeyarchaeia-1]
MRIRKGIEIVENHPALFVEPIDTVVVADLHLGIERELATTGIFLPRFQYQDIKESLSLIINKVAPRQIIVNGDLKHRFGGRTDQEFNEVIDSLSFLTENVENVIVIRGNHDNFVKGLFARFPKTRFVESVYTEGDFTFTHGHVIPLEIGTQESKVIVIGHEHPAIGLRDDVGAKVKLRALLVGSAGPKKELVVLPAYSPLALGAEVNMVTYDEEILSPFLKSYVPLESMRAYGIDSQSGIFSFPELKYWRGTEPTTYLANEHNRGVAKRKRRHRYR